MTTNLIFAGTLAAFWGFLFFGRKLEYATGFKEGVWTLLSSIVIMALISAIIWYCFNPVLPVLGKISVLELSLLFANLAGAMSAYATTAQWWCNADPAVRAQRSFHDAAQEEERSASAAQASEKRPEEGGQAGQQGLGEGEATAEEAVPEEVLS